MFIPSNASVVENLLNISKNRVFIAVKRDIDRIKLIFPDLFNESPSMNKIAIIPKYKKEPIIVNIETVHNLLKNNCF